MFVVAIQLFHGDEQVRLQRLMTDAGLTLLEARTRVRGPGPRVIATFAIGEHADALASRLTWFDPIVLGADDLEMDSAQLLVRRCTLDDNSLRMDLKDGGSVEVPYSTIDLLLRGTRLARERRRTTKPNPRRTGYRAAPTSAIESKDKREQFLYVYAPHLPKLALLEAGLVFTSLGSAMQPTRAANFTWVVEELRARIPTAMYDDRLLTHGGQLHVLGGLLMPESYLDIATTLLSRTLRQPASPYR